MQLGFNTNYRHRGVVFHVQTEDSGRANPHVITHLFHGGNILASYKREYSEEVTAPELKALMESQHKEMLKQLSRGLHDGAIADRLGAGIFGDSTDAADVEPPQAETPTAAEGLEPLHRSSRHDPSARNPVEHPTATNAAASPPSAPEVTRDRLARAFGDGIVSEKPLDEVVLDYLVENARKRKRNGR
jgi:hypothetical protein